VANFALDSGPRPRWTTRSHSGAQRGLSHAAFMDGLVTDGLNPVRWPDR